MAPKKKKKAASNARGFATTSMPSKAKQEQIEASEEEKSKVVEEVGIDTEPVAEPVPIKDTSVAELTETDYLAQKIASKSMDSKKSSKGIPSILLSKKQETSLFEELSFGINEYFRKQRDGLWTKIDLQVAYLRLHQQLGLSLDEVEKIISNCPFSTFDGLVKFICLTYTVEKLPPRLADKFEHDSVNEAVLLQSKQLFKSKKSAVSIGNLSDSSKHESLDAVDSELEVEDKDVHEDVEDRRRMKEWIISRAMQSSSEEEEEVVLVEKSNAELQSDLNELFQKLSDAKSMKEKSIQKEIGKQIATIRKKLGTLAIIPTVESHTAESAKEDSESEFDLFIDEDGIEPILIPAKTSVSVLDLSSKSKWTGMSCQDLLLEFVNRKYPQSRIRYIVEKCKSVNGFQCAIKVDSTPIDVKMDATEIVTTKQDAREYAAIKCLYELGESSLKSRMAPQFRNLIEQWEQAKLNKTQIIQKEVMRRRIDFVESILRKQSQDKQISTTSENLVSPSGPVNLRARAKQPDIAALERRSKKASVVELLKSRKLLPVFDNFEIIANIVAKNRVTCLSSETGSGKSTQLPQILLDYSVKNGKYFNLICTEPRRISAVSLATRVSQEVGDNTVGSWVGFKVKNESKTSNNTVITYCTIGVLLRQLVSDPTLEHVSHIVVDECHERSLDSDFLLLLLKRLLTVRPDLTVILMSATANAEQFANYFGDNVPCLTIPGRQFPVESLFLEDVLARTGFTVAPDSEYRLRQKSELKNYGSSMVTGKGGSRFKVSYSWDQVIRKDSTEDEDEADAEEIDGSDVERKARSAADKQVRDTVAKMDPKKINFDLISHLVGFILRDNPAKLETVNEGSMLVFLPGLWEISKCAEVLEQDFIVKGQSPLLILPLHSGLSNLEQSQVFKQAPSGKLKVVLSTNVAETGVTIPDAVYVIDTVRAREINFDQKRGITRLVDVLISKANVKQRMGRSGRIRPGMSFHLVPFETYEKLACDQKPEMVRLPLEEVCLKIAQLNLGIGSLTETFQALIDPPPLQNVEKAILTLKRLQALDKAEQITNLGKLLGEIPLDARVGKILVFGMFFGALDPVVTCCALLSLGKSPFLFPPGKLEEVKLAHATFYNANSDLLCWLNAFTQFEKLFISKKSIYQIKEFCSARYLNFENLLTVHETRQHLLELISSFGFDVKASRSKYPNERPAIQPELNRNCRNDTAILSAIACGLYPNTIIHSPGTTTLKPTLQILGKNTLPVTLHSQSSLSLKDLSSKFYTFNSIQLKKRGSGKEQAFVFDLTSIPILTYPLFCASEIDFNPIDGIMDLDGVHYKMFGRSGSILMAYKAKFDIAVSNFMDSFKIDSDLIDGYLKFVDDKA